MKLFPGDCILRAADKARALNDPRGPVIELWEGGGEYLVDERLRLDNPSSQSGLRNAIRLRVAKTDQAHVNANPAFGPTIRATFDDEPIISIDQSRGPDIRGVQLRGKNSHKLHSADDIQRDDVWTDAGDSHVGIAIDSYSETGGTGFGCLSGIAIYATSGGVSVSAPGGKQNGDVLTFSNIAMASVGRFAYAFAGTQSKDNAIYGGHVEHAQYWLDCLRPKGAAGFAPAVYGGGCTAVQRLLNLSQVGGAFHMSGFTAESILSIGALGNGTSAANDPAGFHGCTFIIREPLSLPAADVHLYAWRQALLSTCTIQSQNQNYSDFQFRVYNGREVGLDYCQLSFLGHNDRLPVDISNPHGPAVEFRRTRHNTDALGASKVLNGVLGLGGGEIALGEREVTWDDGVARVEIPGAEHYLARGDGIRLGVPAQVKSDPVLYPYVYLGAMGVVKDVNVDDVTIACVSEQVADMLPLTTQVYRRRSAVA